MNKEIAKWLTRRAEAQVDKKLIKEIKDEIRNATKLKSTVKDVNNAKKQKAKELNKVAGGL